MEYQIFQTRHYQRISSMPFNDRTLLAIEICKRLLPDYVSFHQTHQWGDPVRLQNAIRACEEWLAGDTNRTKASDLARHVDVVMPDTDDFGDYDGSYALNACSAVASALQHLVDHDFEHILEIAGLYTDTIDFKLSESGMLDDHESDRHPQMVAARRFLLGDDQHDEGGAGVRRRQG